MDFYCDTLVSTNHVSDSGLELLQNTHCSQNEPGLFASALCSVVQPPGESCDGFNTVVNHYYNRHAAKKNNAMASHANTARKDNQLKSVILLNAKPPTSATRPADARINVKTPKSVRQTMILSRLPEIR